MGEGVRDVAGGIHGLLEVLDEHGEAIEHDLVCAGWTLDDVPDRLSWRTLKAFVYEGAQQRGTALHRVLVGDDHVWGLPEQLLAAIVDAVQLGNWQRSAAGSKKKPKKPKPIPRPGVKSSPSKVGGDTSMPLSKARDLFAAHNPAAFTVWTPPACTVEGCDRAPHARGWCSKHYQRWWRANRG